MRHCSQVSIRRAETKDVDDIHSLIASMTADGTLLPRSRYEIQQQIGTFVVAERDGSEFLGCAALHRYGIHLAEVRSIAVRPEARGLGAGAMLLKSLLAEVQHSGTRCACLFTRIPEFFAHHGFRTSPLSAFRDKVAKDCSRCSRRERCDEVGMSFGELPFDGSLATVNAVRQLVRL